MSVTNSLSSVIEFIESNGCKLVTQSYVNNKVPIIIICHCGNIFQTNFDKFKNRNKRQCSPCGRKNTGDKLRKSHNKFIEEIYSKYGNSFTILGEYITTHKHIQTVHNECGYKWGAEPAHLLSKKAKCPKCAGNTKKTQEEIEYEISEITGGDYVVVGKYVNAITNIAIRHLSCSKIFQISPSNFLFQEQRCPYCKNKSNAEQRIIDILNSEQIDFAYQYRFKDCRNKNPLPFDFAIFKGGELFALIEYDGEFHYSPILGESQLYRTKENDSIKDRYCLDNNIKLIRIPYWESSNIEQILVLHKII